MMTRNHKSPFCALRNHPSKSILKNKTVSLRSLPSSPNSQQLLFPFGNKIFIYKHFVNWSTLGCLQGVDFDSGQGTVLPAKLSSWSPPRTMVAAGGAADREQGKKEGGSDCCRKSLGFMTNFSMGNGSAGSLISLGGFVCNWKIFSSLDWKQAKITSKQAQRKDQLVTL